MELVWLQGDEGIVSYASKYLVVFLVDFNVTRALSTLRLEMIFELRPPLPNAVA